MANKRKLPDQLREVQLALREVNQLLRTTDADSPEYDQLVNRAELLKRQQQRKAQALEAEQELPAEILPSLPPPLSLGAPPPPPRMFRNLGRNAQRAEAAIASHAQAAQALSRRRKGVPGYKKPIEKRRTIQAGVTRTGKPRIVNQLLPGNRELPSLGANVAKAIAGAANAASTYFAQAWKGKGQGLQLSKVVNDAVKRVNMPSYGQFRNELSRSLRDEAKYALLQARAKRIAYNKFKNQMFGRRTQAMRLTKYGSKYSHRKAGLREVEGDFPIAV